MTWLQEQWIWHQATTNHALPSSFCSKRTCWKLPVTLGVLRHEPPISLHVPVINLSLLQTAVLQYCLAPMCVRHTDMCYLVTRVAILMGKHYKPPRTLCLLWFNIFDQIGVIWYLKWYIPTSYYEKKYTKHLTILFISHASKVMLKILQARLQQYANWELPGV